MQPTAPQEKDLSLNLLPETTDPDFVYAFVNLFDPRITNTLENIEVRLERTLEMTKEMRKRRGKHTAAPGSQPLPVTYARSFANALYKLELLLYEYCERSHQKFTSFGKELAELNEDGVCSVEIHVHDDRVMFRMPHLPQRSYKHDLVNVALTSKIYKVLNYPRWSNVTMEFCHVYPTTVKWLPCDNDNYLYKRTIDLICMAMRLSDSPANLDLVKRTVFTDKLPSGTYITVTPKSSDSSDFPHWEND